MRGCAREYAVKVAALLLAQALVLHHKWLLRAIYNSNRGRLTRADLTPFPGTDSPWAYLYKAQNDRAFVLTCGLTVSSFEMLLKRFEPLWWAYSPCTKKFDRVSGVERDLRGSTFSLSSPRSLLHQQHRQAPPHARYCRHRQADPP